MVCAFVLVTHHLAVRKIDACAEGVFRTNVGRIIKACADRVENHVVHFDRGRGGIVGECGVALFALFVAVVVNVASGAPSSRNSTRSAVGDGAGQVVGNGCFPVHVLGVCRFGRKNICLDVVVDVVVFEIRFFYIPLGGRKFFLVDPRKETFELSLVRSVRENVVDAAPFRDEDAQTVCHGGV